MAKGHQKQTIRNVARNYYHRCRKTFHTYNSNHKRTLRPILKSYKPYTKRYRRRKIDMMLSPEEKNEDVFIAFLAADTIVTVYTDLTGKFPVTSISGHKYVMVLYHSD